MLYSIISGKNTKLIFLFLLSFLSFVFLLRYLILGQAVYGDGIYYYAYTRSIVKDQDLHFENEFEHRYSPETNNTLEIINPDDIAPDTKTGHVSNKYPVGTGLAWIPPFLIAEFVANTINIFDNKFVNNGYADIYQITIGLFNVLLSVIGLFFLYKTLSMFFKLPIPLITSAAVALASNLFYYSAIDAINSHPLSFLLGSLFFYFLFSKKLNYKYIILGLIVGCLALTRTQDAVFLSFVVLYSMIDKTTIKEKLINIFFAFVSFAAVFSIQLVSWNIIYGYFLAMPYISKDEGFNFLKPQIIGLLFNLKTGLFIWTPFYIMSMLGLLFLPKKIPKIIIVFILIQFYLISSWSGWTQGESFGIRMLISILPLFAFGLGSLISKIKIKYSFLITFILIIFNFSAIFYFLIATQNQTIDRGNVTQQQIFERLQRLIR